MGELHMLAMSLSEDEFQWLRKQMGEKSEKWAAIRIYSQPDDVAPLSKGFESQFDDILVTYFTDITSEFEEDGKLYKPFHQENYDQIIDFVTKHSDCDKLFVHCTMGVCRSAGVVVGLNRQFDWITAQHGLHGETSVYPYPNVVCWFNNPITQLTAH